MAFTLLGHARHLRKAVINSSFDFSAVQAISRWILDDLEDCSPSFLQLAAQAQALSDAVSLSSGLGLIEIWSTFFVGNRSMSTSSELVDIDKLARCLKGTHVIASA
jgi:midasin